MKLKSTVLTTILILLSLCSKIWALPTNDEGKAKWQNRFPQNPELYIPEPILERTQSVELMMAPADSQLVSYDVLTGEEMVWNISREDMPTETLIKGGEGTLTGIIEEEHQFRNFTDLSKISNAEDYPMCVNCKLYYKKGDTNRVASGILIDPMHVLTAGHCVHEGGGGNWVTDMVVVPAYKNESYPYGNATGISYYAWTGWKWFSNEDDDIAIIKLDRPIGALTGWHGYGYNNDPQFYTQNTFHNASYPAGHPYDGRYLYYWKGSFDCTDYNELMGKWIGNEVGIYRRSYGGQSGSGAYNVEGSDRYVYAVLSSEYLGTTYFPRITGAKFQDIQHFISTNTPSDADLVPIEVYVSPKSAMAGNRLSSLSYVVQNYSSASWNGTVDVSVYLSTNDNISTSDTLIDEHTFTYSFEPKSWVSVDVTTPPVIPIGTGRGNYWIGVILDISDHDTSNNDSDGQTAAPIVVGVNLLSNDQPETFSAIPEEFAFNLNNHDWCCVGIRSSIDHDIRVGDHPDSGPWSAQSNDEGTVCDFIVINGHGKENTTQYAQIHKGLSNRCTIEAEWDIPDLSIGVPESDSIASNEVLQVYEVLLFENEEYNLTLDITSGDSDLAVYIFKPMYDWGSRTYKDWMTNNKAAGGDESLSLTTDSTGYYAIAVINENASSAHYTIVIAENEYIIRTTGLDADGDSRPMR